MLASTQFESVSARRAFPCFDEPIYKAQFDIQLEVDEHLTALSNMNVVEEKSLENGKKLLTFARTPVMSTYLVAFAVGEFEYIEVN
jgi:aminopeptidase N